jgi:hypothetical protein
MKELKIEKSSKRLKKRHGWMGDRQTSGQGEGREGVERAIERRQTRIAKRGSSV